MTNVAELQRVLDFIEHNPKRHIQDEWICGTGACFAGWVCLLNGWKWFHGDDWASADRVYHGRKPKMLDVARTRHIRELAIEILDLDLNDAVILFWGNNTPRKLRVMVNELAENGKLVSDWIPVVGRRNVVTMQQLEEN